MNIELPKDAEGREIPLDTVALFSSDGNVLNIVRWIYTTDFDLRDDLANSWKAINDTGAPINPELMYLTPPDSREKLEEDLGRAASKGFCRPCAYFATDSVCCDMCPIGDITSCGPAAMRDIASRIRRLRG